MIKEGKIEKIEKWTEADEEELNGLEEELSGLIKETGFMTIEDFMTRSKEEQDEIYKNIEEFEKMPEEERMKKWKRVDEIIEERGVKMVRKIRQPKEE